MLGSSISESQQQGWGDRGVVGKERSHVQDEKGGQGTGVQGLERTLDC